MVLAILKRLFGRKRVKRPGDLIEAQEAVSSAPEVAKTSSDAGPAPAQQRVIGPKPTPLVYPSADNDCDGEEADDDEFEANELIDDEPDADDDPTVGRLEPLQISLPEASVVERDRSDAERIALSGAQTITPNDPAGPGSLAETLVRMEARGLVTSRIVEDDEGGFRILYEPVTSAVS